MIQVALLSNTGQLVEITRLAILNSLESRYRLSLRVGASVEGMEDWLLKVLHFLINEGLVLSYYRVPLTVDCETDSLSVSPVVFFCYNLYK